jgi:nitrous oxidase accessory protein NosD
MTFRTTRRVAVAAAAVASLAAATQASAADTFVDPAIGKDASSCLSAAQPCATIAAAIAKAGSGDTIHVGPGTYEEAVTLDDGKSLKGTKTAASSVIHSATAPTVHVTGPAGTIQGLTIRGEGTDSAGFNPVGVLTLDATATVRGNVFDTDDDTSNAPLDVFLGTGAGSAAISQNSFHDDGVDGSKDTTGVMTFSSGSPLIASNELDGMFDGIVAIGGTPVVRDNVITGTHNRSDNAQGFGIEITGNGTLGANGTVTGNLVRAPRARAAAGEAGGIGVFQFVTGPSAPAIGANLHRNRVAGGSVGISIFNTAAAVSLDGDAVTDTTSLGLQTSATSPMSLSVTGATFAANSFDVQLGNTALTLNSTIVEDPISATNGSTCAISFSRGPTTSGNACQTFQTNADPLFATTPAGADKNIHLQPTSPMRGAGTTAAPPPGAVDIDGDTRVLPSNGTSSPSREIGADEFVPTDISNPDTSIDSGPANGGVASGAPAFTFSSPNAGTSFQCSLDGVAFTACTSPVAYEGLGGGQHTFAVRTMDDTAVLDGQLPDLTPATRTFTADLDTPDTAISSGPAQNATSNGSPSFTFSSEAGASFECSLDGGAFTTCPSPDQLSGLADGRHSLAVRALDPVGNADRSAATRSWVVDATGPDTQFTSGPADGALSNDASPRYGFSSEAGASFECSVDGGPFAPCSPPAGPGKLADGRHRFAVRAVDAVGNADSSPAERSVRIDTSAPDTKVAKAKVKGRKAKLKLTSDDPSATFECKLDKQGFKPCGPKVKLKRLRKGKHVLLARAVDEAGNADSSPAKAKLKVRRR